MVLLARDRQLNKIGIKNKKEGFRVANGFV